MAQNIKVYIRYDENELMLPVNPQELNVQRGVRNFAYDILMKGRVHFPNTPDPYVVNFDTQFWNDEMYWQQAGINAYQALDFVESWRASKSIGELLVVNEWDGIIEFPGLHLFVYCDDFDTNLLRAGEEDDIYFSMSMVEVYRGAFQGEEDYEVDVEVDEETGQSYYNPKPPVMPEPPIPQQSTFIVRSGDNLYNIALREFGQPRGAWVELFEIPENRAIIGENPHLIRPGQELIIPESWLR